MPAKLVEATEFGTLEALISSWERSLRAGNKSPKTIRAYGDSARQFEVFAREKLGVTAVNKMTRETDETFIADQLARWKPTTASVRYRCLQQLFKWLLEEGEITADPMARMKPPIVPEVPVPVVWTTTSRSCSGPATARPSRTIGTSQSCACSSTLGSGSPNAQGRGARMSTFRRKSST